MASTSRYGRPAWPLGGGAGGAPPSLPVRGTGEKMAAPSLAAAQGGSRWLSPPVPGPGVLGAALAVPPAPLRSALC